MESFLRVILMGMAHGMVKMERYLKDSSAMDDQVEKQPIQNQMAIS